MQVVLTDEQSDVVRIAIEAGRTSSDVQAVQQALSLWVEKARRLADLKSSLDAAEASLAAGLGTDITEDGMRALAEDVMQKAARRLAKSAEATCIDH